LSDTPYKDISAAWTAEVESEELQDLEDLRFGKMKEYLSKIRYNLTETPAENQLQADMYTQEALNLEFMLKDLLMMRREKIVRAALGQKSLFGKMMVSEELLYRSLQREFQGHSDFVKEALTGLSSPTSRKLSDGKETIPQEDVVDYVIVRFLRSIDEAIIGIDEQTYGPFKKEDLAAIPLLNANAWSEDGTVVRVSIHGGGTG